MEAAQDASVVITKLEDTDVPSPAKVDGGKARGIRLTDSQVQNRISEFLSSVRMSGTGIPSNGGRATVLEMSLPVLSVVRAKWIRQTFTALNHFFLLGKGSGGVRSFKLRRVSLPESSKSSSQLFVPPLPPFFVRSPPLLTIQMSTDWHAAVVLMTLDSYGEILHSSSCSRLYKCVIKGRNGLSVASGTR